MLLICAGFVPVCSAGTDDILSGRELLGVVRDSSPTRGEKLTTVTELLDKYAETQDKLQSSFIIRSENISRVNGSVYGGGLKANKLRINRSVELRTDGNRISFRMIMHENENSTTKASAKDKSSYMSSLWDGKCYSHYTSWYPQKLGDGKVSLGRVGDDSHKKGMIPIGYNGHEMLGIFCGDYERVDSVLHQADAIFVRDTTERIGDSDCYVIKAVVKNRGKYTVWIDPQYGYNIAKATIRRGENAILYDEAPRKIRVEVFNSINNIRFKKIDNVWLPMEADIVINRKWNNGDFAKIKQHHRFTEIIMHPDHDALGSFERDDIKNGAMVYIRGHNDSKGGPIEYTWRDGKVVDAQGQAIAWNEVHNEEKQKEVFGEPGKDEKKKDPK